MIIGIFAVDASGGVGFKNQLPWPRNADDLWWFNSVTMLSTVIMGRNTWLSLGQKPLTGRKNLVVSSAPVLGAKCLSIDDFGRIVEQESQNDSDVFIIGGPTLLWHARPLLTTVLMTRIPGTYPSDSFIDINLFLQGYEFLTAVDFATCRVEEYRLPCACELNRLELTC